MKRLRVIIKGKVQGVYFRATTETVALEIGITGFVRNQKDGSVYIEAQGEEEQLSKFVNWCKQGPQRAVVENVELEEIVIVAEKAFIVLRH